MAVPSPADFDVSPRCIECGADISPKMKFCLICGASQMKAVPTSSKVVAWYASLLGLAKFCYGCGATQNDDDKSSKGRRLLILSGIAAVVVLIVLASIFWSNNPPISAEAQYDLGVKDATGQGVQQDDAQAVSWFQKAAGQGYAAAQGELGGMYENG